MHACMDALAYVDVHIYWFLHKLDTNIYANNKKYDNVKCFSLTGIIAS